MSEATITLPKWDYEIERKMRVFGTTSEEISKKKHNIFIGVSISNKKLDEKMAYDYLRWSVKNTKEKVAVVIADELDIVNYEIFSSYSSGKARKRAEREGEKFKGIFERAIKKLSEKDQDKVIIYKWSDVKRSKNYDGLREFVTKSYEEYPEFKSGVLFFVKKYIRKRGKLKILENKEKIDRLATYLFGELPTLLQGIYLDGIHYDICIYPTYFASGMSQFVTDLLAGELDISKPLASKLKGKAALVEVWLD
ncbi:tRNA-dependent cyclodipeptide synthase [Candidatus Pacearchaeota archaeon]|nr:tRNA-dependent cyclodipeptide synthase [Candidatus Pacearchaeota archaeon]